MNPSLSAIAAAEGDGARFMPPPPIAYHDHGQGMVEQVPLVSREFLMRCGVESLYIILQQMDASERFDAESKEDLATLILAKTQGQQPPSEIIPPPIIPPLPMTVERKRLLRSAKRQVREAVKQMRKESRSPSST